MGDSHQTPAQPPGKWESIDTDDYDKRWKELEAEGHNTHGEADFVCNFEPTSVLDAGCGTGRVAIELAKRGCDVVGVDLDGPMIAAAQSKAPSLDFRCDDLATVNLDRQFDVVVLAGNVMIFVTPGTEAQVVAQMAAHVSPGGHLIAGFQLGHGLTVEAYNSAASAAGLAPSEHWSTWDRDAAGSDDGYAVLVHALPA